MDNLADIYTRLAKFYINRMQTWHKDYETGGSNMLRALREYDEESTQINDVQIWLSANFELGEEIAVMCERFPKYCPYIFNIRLVPEEYIKWVESALKASRFLNNHANEVAHLGHLGSSNFFLGKLDTAQEITLKALEIYTAIGLNNLGLKGSLINILGLISASKGQVTEGINLFLQHLDIAKELNDMRAMIGAHGALGIAYNKIAKYDLSLKHLEESLSLATSVGDLLSQGKAFNGLGNVYTIIGKSELALHYYKESLIIKRRLVDKFGIGNTLLNVGIVYLDQMKFDLALEQFEEGLSIAIEISDLRMQGKLVNYKGKAHTALGNFDLASSYLGISLDIFENVGDSLSTGQIYGDIASVYKNKDDLENSLRYYDKSLELARKTNDRDGEAAALFGIGEILFLKKDRHGAIHKLRETLSIYEEIGHNGSMVVSERLNEWLSGA